MDIVNEKYECKKLSVYYYDYMFGGRDLLPESTLEHFSVCPHCMAEMNLLKSELDNCDGAEVSQPLESARIANIELHFAYLNKPVSCTEARQFLAVMASSFAINIPTPITVHINNCPSCAADLNTLRDLKLPEKNLFKVGQILADELCCGQGEDEISDRVRRALSDIEFQQSEIEKLVKIACRPASGIRTLLNLEGEGSGSVNHENDRIYEDWQVAFTLMDDNGVCQSRPLSETKNHVETVRSRKPFLHFKLNRILKPVAAAAVLAVAFIMFKGPSATADLDQVYKAMENVRNVYIKTVDVKDGELLQEIWVSRDQEMLFIKSAKQAALWNLGKKRVVHADYIDSKVEIEELDSDSVRLAQRSMSILWSLFPSNSISALPSGATWHVLTDETGAQPGMEIYELFWTRQSVLSTEPYYTKWRAIIESDTFLPKRIEWWGKNNADDEYSLETIKEISYPDTEQVKAVIGKFKSQQQSSPLP